MELIHYMSQQDALDFASLTDCHLIKIPDMELIAKDNSEATRYLDHLYDIYNAMAMSNPEVLVLILCGHIDIALILY